jgi:DNA-binding CsgD family transcriptional regulator
MNTPLDESDVRLLVRLLGEVAAFDSDHTGKKRFLMDGLCTLIEADAWVWALMCQPGNGQPQVYVNLVHGGFDDTRFARLLQALEHPEMSWVARTFFAELQRKGTQITRTRQQIVDDEIFLKTDAANAWRAADIGPVLMSTRPLGNGAGSSIAIYRSFGAAHFSERESRMAHIVLTEVPWLHELGWPDDRGATVPKLYPQQRIVLNLLLEGLDRKTIADRLGISIHTVSGYCKEIYRHFNVNSQAILMARFYKGNGDDLP